ncbi:MAG: hypothetical protein ACO28M_03905 [Vulcanococcus sp.]
MTSASESSLAFLLEQAITNDIHEEDAIEFLEDHGIPFFTHNRQFLITLAYRNGWRPTP